MHELILWVNMSKYKVLQLSLPCKRWMLLKCKFDSPYFHLQELRTFNQLRWTEINRSMCPWPNAKQWKLRDATWLAMLREDFLSRLLPSSCKSFCKNSKSGLVSVASIFSTCTCSIWAAKSLRWEFLTGLKVKQTFRLTVVYNNLVIILFRTDWLALMWDRKSVV